MCIPCIRVHVYLYVLVHVIILWPVWLVPSVSQINVDDVTMSHETVCVYCQLSLHVAYACWQRWNEAFPYRLGLYTIIFFYVLYIYIPDHILSDHTHTPLPLQAPGLIFYRVWVLFLWPWFTSGPPDTQGEEGKEGKKQRVRRVH